MYLVDKEATVMKTGVYIAAVAIGFCAVGAVALYCWHRRKHAVSIQKTETVEDRFISEWTAVLTNDARVFNGLFSGLQRVVDGVAKKPEKVLREWCQRTHYKWENAQADILCQRYIVPLIESADWEALTNWANLLLDAAAAAGIRKEETAMFVLTESNVADYVEWDGNDLYPADEIEIITPAWYQNGKLLEQGQCRKCSNEED